MVYLIGVNHDRAQRRGYGQDLTDCHRRFRSVVESAIQSIHPCLLAEEDHPDFLSEYGADSILKSIADSLGSRIGHRFVDPGRAEREELGYRSQRRISEICPSWPNGYVVARAHEIAHHFRKREGFWLQKLEDSLENDILFVCGWGHVESFRGLLTSKGVASSILARAIGILPSRFKFDKAVREYIRDCPAEFNK